MMLFINNESFTFSLAVSLVMMSMSFSMRYIKHAMFTEQLATCNT